MHLKYFLTKINIHYLYFPLFIRGIHHENKREQLFKTTELLQTYYLITNAAEYWINFGNLVFKLKHLHKT